MPPRSPVSMMSAGTWLRTVVALAPAAPSPELLRFFKACDRGVEADISHRAHVILTGIFGCAQWGLEAAARDEAQIDALRLYYRVLAAVCRDETSRLATSNHSALLINERFHRCMLAVSAEVVLNCLAPVLPTFPRILEPAGITAFDLFKGIDGFVKHEDSLPRDIKRHLNAVDERILESAAWEKASGSALYNTLVVARKVLAPEIMRLKLLAEPMVSLDALSSHPPLALANGMRGPGSPSRTITDRHPAPHLFLGPLCCLPGEPPGSPRSPQASSRLPNGISIGSPSPIRFASPGGDRISAFSTFASPAKREAARMQPPPLQSTFASPQRPNPSGGGESCAEAITSAFLHKVARLAAIRIRNLCERLGQSPAIAEQVKRVLEHAVHHETALFFNRHIDQIVLSSIYGVCKVSHVSVTFKDIIAQYRKQPQCKPYVFRNVFIDLPHHNPGQPAVSETGDIIRFYNEVFVPSTKTFLLQLGSSDGGPLASAANGLPSRDGTMSPGTHFTGLPTVSPKRVSAAHNVYVSPLRSKVEDRLPGSRNLFALLGDSPSHDLATINQRISSGRRLGKLSFTDERDVEDDKEGKGSVSNSSNFAVAHNLEADSVLSQSQTSAADASSSAVPSGTEEKPSPSASPLKRARIDRVD
eukprot:SM000278S10005  [mRNA]  locus=s278:144950:148772:+ [translate_table: standard]